MVLVIGAVLLVLAAIVILTLPEESGTFTSKPMAAPHAHLRGQEKCDVCHVTQEKVSDQLCLDCHQPLKDRIAAKLGFHAQVQAECARCHGEHQGKDFQVVAWPGDKNPFQPVVGRKPGEASELDHETATGFALKDAHASDKLACDKCHTNPLIRDGKVASFKGLEGAPKPERPHGEPDDQGQQTYLGLGAACSDCHRDAHVPSQGEDCEKCHGEKSFKPAENFNHDQDPVRFALSGKHKDLKCEKCHLQPPSSKPAAAPKSPLPSFEALVAETQPRPFRGAGFGVSPATPVRGETLPSCVACHQNVHRQKSEAFDDCTSCHDAVAWNLSSSASFDHGNTDFPLEGAHSDPKKADCADCHGGEKLDGPVKRTCVECHEKDDLKAHLGGFNREMVVKGQSCEMCHDAVDWKKSTYPLKDHPAPIALADGHAIKCEICHGTDGTVLALEGKRIPIPRLPKEPGLAVDRGPQEKACAACHGDPHEGRMERELEKDCIDCHDFKNFNLAELDNEGHAKIGFPIVDAHAALDGGGKAEVSCEDCHGTRNASGGLRRLSLTEVRVQGCVVCHADPHQGQLKTKCDDCHTEKVFEPSTFDLARHQDTRLPLRQAHLAVPCEECHARELKALPEAKDPTKLAQRFTWDDPGKEVSCERCHEDPHAQQFGSTNCSSCHGTDHFEPSAFEVLAGHRRVGFPLEGPHSTKCSACHVSGVKHGKAITYRQTPKDCAGCHLDIHLGQFSEKRLGCQACHKIEDWKPSRFDHDKCRFPLQGAHAEEACDSCHLSRDRVFPDGEKRTVVHYYPIAGRDCGDCHQNPHSKDAGPSGSGKPGKSKNKAEPTSGKRGRR